MFIILEAPNVPKNPAENFLFPLISSKFILVVEGAETVTTLNGLPSFKRSSNLFLLFHKVHHFIAARLRASSSAEVRTKDNAPAFSFACSLFFTPGKGCFQDPFAGLLSWGNNLKGTLLLQ
jgi:hypothetical protein